MNSGENRSSRSTPYVAAGVASGLGCRGDKIPGRRCGPLPNNQRLRRDPPSGDGFGRTDRFIPPFEAVVDVDFHGDFTAPGSAGLWTVRFVFFACDAAIFAGASGFENEGVF